MTLPKCAITGCALVVEDRWVAGDLFDAGDYWVFNGNVTQDSQPAWNVGVPFYTKQLFPRDWWEKRGVFVIPKSLANLNQVAREYLES